MPWKRRYRLRSERPWRNSSTAPASAAAGGRSRSVPPSLRMTSTAPATASSTLDANRGSFTLALLAPRRLALEHDLQRVRLRCGREHVVGRHRLVEREAMRGERRRVEPSVRDQLQQPRRGERVHEAGHDRHVPDPQLLEVERSRVAVNAHVGDATAGPHDVGAELERLRHADRFDRHVRAEPAGQLHDPLDRVLAAVVDDDVGAELERLVEARVREVDRDDPPGRVQLRRHDRGQADRPCPDDRDRVARLHVAVQHANLVGGREDVGEEQHLLVGELVRHLVDRGVRERHPRQLRLEPVDQVAEDPAAASGAEAVVAFLAEPAAPARREARHQPAIARFVRRRRVAGLDDRSDRLVAEDRAGPHLGDVALEDVEVGPADRRRVDPDDGVRRLLDRGVCDLVPGALPGTVVHECLHGSSFRSPSASRACARATSAPAPRRPSAFPQYAEHVESASPSEPRLRALLEAGMALASELSLDTLLQRLTSVAAELTGARYAALGVIDPTGSHLERFITHGIDVEARAAIGDPPHGRGILGALIRDARPLRLHAITDDPRSVGFPANHPPMGTFLGVPILLRGVAYGNLYLTDKAEGADFTQEDQELVGLLASQAAVGIENARLYESSTRWSRQLESLIEGSGELARETDVDVLLELLAQRLQELLEARLVAVALPAGEGQLRIVTAAGDGAGQIIGRMVERSQSKAGRVLERGRSERVDSLLEDREVNLEFTRGIGARAGPWG